MKTKRAEEVAYHILPIFLTFGAPAILQSDNDREFSNQVLFEMYAMWKDVKIVHGKPRHSQIQGSVERANQDIQNMVTAWMNDNNTNKWSEGLPFFQFARNTTCHEGIRQSPPAQIGDTVRLQVPDVDCGHTDNRNVLAVVVGIEDSDFYKLANEDGTLKQLYAHNQLEICKEELLSKDKISFQEISLREAAAANSRSGEQGYACCHCKRKCSSNKCSCKSKGLLCNLKCHNSLNCCNK